MALPKDAYTFHGQVAGFGTIHNNAPMAPAPAAKPDAPTAPAPAAAKPDAPTAPVPAPAAKLEPSLVTQHAEQYTSAVTTYPYPPPHRYPPAPYMRPQKPPPPAYYGYGGFDGYWGDAAGAYGGGGYYGYQPPQPPPYGSGDGGGYGYYPPSEIGWGSGGNSYFGGGHGGGGYRGGGGGYGYGGGGYGGGGDRYGGGGGGHGRPPPHAGTGWLAAPGAAAYGGYQHHMRKHHQGYGHGHGGGDVCGACGGRGCSHGGCAAIHGEFEHEHHTKFKHSTAHHHDGNCGEHDIVQAPHVSVLEKRTTTEVVHA